MAVDDRDYMREHLQQQLEPAPRRNRIKQILIAATAILVVGSAAIWLLRDTRGLRLHAGPAEGLLRVNINTATLTELESIPGIGKSLALLIVAKRPYQSVDQLVDVRGIGPKSLESLRPFVKVEGEAEKLR